MATLLEMVITLKGQVIQMAFAQVVTLLKVIIEIAAGATGNSTNSIPRSGIAPPPGMVNSPNFDGQVKAVSNDNGKSVAEEEQVFPSGT